MPVERAGSSTNSSTASSSFWRDGGARPGRVSGGGAKRGGGGGGGSRQTGPTGSGVPAHTFHDFQARTIDKINQHRFFNDVKMKWLYDSMYC